MVLIVLVGLVFLVYIFLIAYYRKGWQDLPEYILPAQKSFTIPVAIIIPARNESANIGCCLQSLLAQTYPPHLLQIRVVDDFSTDDTAAIVQNFSRQHSHIQLTTPQQQAAGQAYKKRAIEAGIAASTAPLIVCTDADCTFHPQWIAALVAFQQEKDAHFIAAPVNFIAEDSLLSVFQSLDFMTLQGITGASVYRRFHTMCNGANLLYTRSAFTAVNGFNGIDHIPTGDDMLLMYKIYRQHPQQVFYLKNKNAIVATPAAESWKAFFNQRIRWASKAVHYEDKRIFWTLLLVYLFNVSFLVLWVAAFFHLKYLLALLLFLLGKTMVEMWFVLPVARFFGKQARLWQFPMLQPLHIGYTILAGWLGRFGSYQWKGRTITKLAGKR